MKKCIFTLKLQFTYNIIGFVTILIMNIVELMTCRLDTGKHLVDEELGLTRYSYCSYDGNARHKEIHRIALLV